jgi:hypothetical protein
MSTATARTALAAHHERRPIIMPALIALFLVAVVILVVALAVIGFAAHILFTPWLLLAVVAILAWLKFRPRRTR